MNVDIILGDITKTAVQCIVNAANQTGLGCHNMDPHHHCVDKVIHLSAGPCLYEACKKQMIRYNNLLPESGTFITPGFNLPSKFVLHVNGPIYNPNLTQQGNLKRLSRAYETCLHTAISAGITELAFCSISTGLYGYPPEMGPSAFFAALANASTTAKTIKIIMILYKLEDYAIWQHAVAKMQK